MDVGLIMENNIVSCSDIENAKNLIFNFEGSNFTVTPKDYIHDLNYGGYCKLFIEVMENEDEDDLTDIFILG